MSSADMAQAMPDLTAFTDAFAGWFVNSAARRGLDPFCPRTFTAIRALFCSLFTAARKLGAARDVPCRAFLELQQQMISSCSACRCDEGWLVRVELMQARLVEFLGRQRSAAPDDLPPAPAAAPAPRRTRPRARPLPSSGRRRRRLPQEELLCLL